jgi:hypothetical protein
MLLARLECVLERFRFLEGNAEMKKGPGQVFWNSRILEFENSEILDSCPPLPSQRFL